jgi:hypothetical protein
MARPDSQNLIWGEYPIATLRSPRSLSSRESNDFSEMETVHAWNMDEIARSAVFHFTQAGAPGACTI